MDDNLLIEFEKHLNDLVLFNKDKIEFENYEYELALTHSKIKLYSIDEDFNENSNSNKELIATIEGKYFDINYVYDMGLNLYEIFDMYDGDSESLVSILLDDNGDIKDEYLSFNDDIYYLDRIYVEDKFKEQGYAKFLLNNLVNILRYQAKINCGIIIVLAQPFDIINGEQKMVYNDKKRTERLIKLYENCGFKRINKTNYLIITTE